MMTTSELTAVTLQGLDLILYGSAPAIIAAGVAGVTVSLVQALTQVQDQGLPTAAKFFAIMATLYATYMIMSHQLMNYSEKLFLYIERI